MQGSCATGMDACTPVCAELNASLVSSTKVVCGQDGGPPAMSACFDVPDAGVCPTNYGVALNQFLALGCPTGWEPYEILSGPSTDVPGQCCYMVHDILCGSGGRPFLVGDTPRLAAATQGDGAHGWTLGGQPRLEGLSAEDRGVLAEAWTADALAEHASIASFARFSLSLLAVGAPADLVTATHEAALDEVRHARVCFALAAAYAGEPIAPGAFPVGDALHVETSLATLAARTFEEGCIGETVAAIVAGERALQATDPVVRAALAEIAEDEARHAELAWRSVAWALTVGGGAVRSALEEAALRAFAGVRAAIGSPSGSPTRVGHGLLDGASIASVVASAMSEVVGPAARALLRPSTWLSIAM